MPSLFNEETTQSKAMVFLLDRYNATRYLLGAIFLGALLTQMTDKFEVITQIYQDEFSYKITPLFSFASSCLPILLLPLFTMRNY